MSKNLVETSHGTICLEPAADGCIVILTGEHDLTSADALARVLAAARAISPTTVVDLARATFIDCRVLGVLVEHRNTCVLAGGDVTLVVSPASLARRVIELTHVDDVFPVVGSRPDVAPRARGTDVSIMQATTRPAAARRKRAPADDRVA